jgi:geranylgeranyl diphosphate synthase type I
MHALARLALLGLESRRAGALLIVACGSLLDETCLALCEGQYLDISFQGQEGVTVADYMEMIARKTAALFSASLEMGALLGGASARTAARFRGAGRQMGLAYQIRDDVLDLWGGPALGKDHATDLRNKKKTLPVVYGLAQGATSAGRRLRELYGQPALSDSDIDEAVRQLEELQAPAFCAREADRCHAAALAELEGAAHAGPPLEELRAVADVLIHRHH